MFDQPDSERTVERLNVTCPVGARSYAWESVFKGLYGWLSRERVESEMEKKLRNIDSRHVSPEDALNDLYLHEEVDDCGARTSIGGKCIGGRGRRAVVSRLGFL